MINLILSVLALAGLAIAGFGVFMIVQAIGRNQPARSGALLTAVGVIIAVVFFILSAGLVEIQPSEVGVVFNVLSGPLCDDESRWWWLVRSGDLEGWMAEGAEGIYYLEPLT